ncbi:MAG: guanylate kinase [Dehalococcoidales bacterium]|nr:guanylate kinase [Dehalococcoidales bacterium]
MTKSNSNNDILWNGAKKPLLLVLSGPSGAGKDAVLNRLKMVHFPIAHITTMTTRAKRPREKDGIDYNFVTEEQFQRLIDNNELLEWANVYGNFYGVPKQAVREALAEGKDTIIKIDVQGAATIKKIVPQAIFIFLAPLTMQELIDRLTMRNTESEENLRLRIDTVKEEMTKLEMFDYVAVNEHGQIDRVVDEIRAIINTEKMRVTPREYNL